LRILAGPRAIDGYGRQNIPDDTTLVPRVMAFNDEMAKARDTGATLD